MSSIIKNKLHTIAKNKYINTIENAIHKHIRNNNIQILNIGAGSCWLLRILPHKYTKIGLDLHAHHLFIDNTFIDFLNTKSLHFVCGYPSNTMSIIE